MLIVVHRDYDRSINTDFKYQCLYNDSLQSYILLYELIQTYFHASLFSLSNWCHKTLQFYSVSGQHSHWSDQCVNMFHSQSPHLLMFLPTFYTYSFHLLPALFIFQYWVISDNVPSLAEHNTTRALHFIYSVRTHLLLLLIRCADGSFYEGSRG